MMVRNSPKSATADLFLDKWCETKVLDGPGISSAFQYLALLKKLLFGSIAEGAFKPAIDENGFPVSIRLKSKKSKIEKAQFFNTQNILKEMVQTIHR